MKLNQLKLYLTTTPKHKNQNGVPECHQTPLILIIRIQSDTVTFTIYKD